MPRPISGRVNPAQQNRAFAPAPHSRRGYAIKHPPYMIPKDVIKEIVKHKLVFSGKVSMPTIEAPYGLYDDEGRTLGPKGIIFAYNFDKKFTLACEGARICAPLLIEEFNRHRDVLKLFACREAVKIWEKEEIETGKFGPFLTNSELTRKKLSEFGEMNEEEQKEIRFYAKILQIASRYLKLCKEMEIIHTEHAPVKIFSEGPIFPHPERVSKGHAVFLKEARKLPEFILTEFGLFNLSKLSHFNDPKKIRELSWRFYSEFNVVDINSLFSFSAQYPFMEGGEVKIYRSVTEDASLKQSRLIRRWFEIRDYVFLLHNL